MTKEALTLALEALELAGGNLCEALHHPKKLQHGIGEPCPAVAKYDQAITAIKEALSSLNGEAQPEQRSVRTSVDSEHLEPVACYEGDEDIIRYKDIQLGAMLYTTPPQRTWVGLSDDETAELVHRYAFYELTRQIEAKLKEKNT